MIEFGKSTGQVGIKFKNDGGDEVLVQVHDKFPEMQDVHIEGRRFVEVSIEMFMYLMDSQGFRPVNPHDGEDDNDEKRA